MDVMKKALIQLLMNEQKLMFNVEKVLSDVAEVTESMK